MTDGPAWTPRGRRPEHPVTRRLEAARRHPATARARCAASAADLYLALWNRGGAVDDPTGLLDEWRERGAVTW